MWMLMCRCSELNRDLKIQQVWYRELNPRGHRFCSSSSSSLSGTKKCEKEIKDVSCGGDGTSICHITVQNLDHFSRVLNSFHRCRIDQCTVQYNVQINKGTDSWHHNTQYIYVPSNLLNLTEVLLTNRMAVMRLLMESDTMREWPARTDQVGGSLGLITSERAVLIRWVELSSMERADWRIGSWAAQPYRTTKVNFSQNEDTCAFIITSRFFCSWPWTLQTLLFTWLYLAADLSGDTGKLWVGSERRQVFHSLN